MISVHRYAYTPPPLFTPLQIPDEGTLRELTKKLILEGVTTSTARKYTYSQQTFYRFCLERGKIAVPCSKETFLNYAAWLRLHKRLGPEAVRGHLAAVKQLHTINGVELTAGNDPRVKLLRRAANKRSSPGDARTPVSWEILKVVLARLAGKDGPDDKLISAAAALGYFGFLRVSEICGREGPDGNQGLMIQNLSMAQLTLLIRLEESKGDTRREGAVISFNAIPEASCPLKLLAEYLAVRPRSGGIGPLFLKQDGSPMSAAWFRAHLKKECEAAGFKGDFNAHSLSIGAATDAANKGIPAYTIKLLGRWKSDAFLRYLRPSSGQLGASRAPLAAL